MRKNRNDNNIFFYFEEKNISLVIERFYAFVSFFAISIICRHFIN